MHKVKIYVYTTYLELWCDRITGDVLPSVQKSIREFLSSRLTEYKWDYEQRKWLIQARYCKYDYRTSMVRMTRYALDDLINWLGSIPHEVEYCDTPIPPTINVKMRPWSKRDKRKIEDREDQVDLISFMSDPEQAFKALEASTGIGKTYTSIKATLVQLGVRTLIQTDRLADMWLSELLDKTTLKRDEIFILKGRASVIQLAKIAQSGRKKNFPKCIIASQRTLARYAAASSPPYNEIPPLHKVLKLLEFGAMIVDEVHMAFHTNTLIALSVNLPFNIFLSATYERSNEDSDAIFKLTFPESIRYGAHHTKRYTDVFVYSYTLGGVIGSRSYCGREGYMQSKYEDALCNNKQAFKALVQHVLKPIIQMHYLNIALPGERLLILVYRRKLAGMLAEELQKLYPDQRVITFLGGDSDEKYEKGDCDWVVSSLGSFGTGRDLRRLITAIQLTSFEASATAKQCVGRLRHIKGRTTVYVDLYNRDIDAHRRHIKKRGMAYRTKALNYYEGQLS